MLFIVQVTLRVHHVCLSWIQLLRESLLVRNKPFPLVLFLLTVEGPSGVFGFTGQRRVAPLVHCSLAK
jgi:hypothetical protein